MPVAVVALVLLLLYAVGFPVFMACMMCQHKARSASQRRASTGDGGENGSVEDMAEPAAPPDYWTSTRPAAEMVWYPLVAHLQVRPPPSL
jgi:hypothetical protein